MFSARWVPLRMPGIGMVFPESPSSQARDACAGVAVRAATRATPGDHLVLREGLGGEARIDGTEVAVLEPAGGESTCEVAASERSERHERGPAVPRPGEQVIGAGARGATARRIGGVQAERVACAASACAMVTSESPSRSILPSPASSARAPRLSARGTPGPNRSMRSTPSRTRLSSTWRRRVSGRPSRCIRLVARSSATRPPSAATTPPSRRPARRSLWPSPWTAAVSSS